MKVGLVKIQHLVEYRLVLREWVKNRFSDISYYGLKYFEIEQLPLINETCLL